MRNLTLLIFLFLSMNIFSKPVFMDCKYEAYGDKKSLTVSYEIDIEKGTAAVIFKVGTGMKYSVNSPNKEGLMAISSKEIVLGSYETDDITVIQRDTLKSTSYSYNKWVKKYYIYNDGLCELVEKEINNKF